MPPQRRVSPRQMELLLDFAESHRDIALGRFPGGPQAVRLTREKWASAAAQFNAVAEGVTKTPDQWRRYWIELKAKTKAKAADYRRNAAVTGGGPSKHVPLSAMEERVLALISPVAVDGLPGVRIPIDLPNVSPPRLVQEEMEVEWLEEIPHLTELEIPPPPLYQDVEQRDTTVEQPISSTDNNEAQIQPNRRQRRIHRDESVPQWAYEIETRRIAAEERHAAALEAMVDLLRQIREDIHAYIQK